MPLLAAAVGVLGGVGGAYIGGVVANEGQEQQSKSERAGAIQDSRIEEYGNFIATAEEIRAEILAGENPNPAGIRLFKAQAVVALITENVEVEEAATAVVKELTGGRGSYADYVKARDQFRDVARDEIAETEG